MTAPDQWTRAAFILTMVGQPTLEPFNKQVVDNRTTRGDLRLDVPTGEWTVHVLTEAGQQGELPERFEVPSERKCYLPIVFSTYGEGYPTIACGGSYPGKPKEEDWYKFTLGGSRTVTLQVTNYPTKGQMQLRRNSPDGALIEMDGTEGPTKTVGPRSLGAGTYFVRLYPGTGYEKNNTYTLKMTCN
jgi:hypothetical protein